MYSLRNAFGRDLKCMILQIVNIFYSARRFGGKGYPNGAEQLFNSADFLGFLFDDDYTKLVWNLTLLKA